MLCDINRYLPSAIHLVIVINTTIVLEKLELTFKKSKKCQVNSGRET